MTHQNKVTFCFTYFSLSLTSRVCGQGFVIKGLWRRHNPLPPYPAFPGFGSPGPPGFPASQASHFGFTVFTQGEGAGVLIICFERLRMKKGLKFRMY